MRVENGVGSLASAGGAAAAAGGAAAGMSSASAFVGAGRATRCAAATAATRRSHPLGASGGARSVS